MTTRISVAASNTRTAATTALLNGGSIQIRTGSQPATVETAATGTLLGTLALSATAFAAPSNGTATANTITGDTSADASGTAGWFRVLNSSGVAVIDGAIGASGSGAEMILSTTTVAAGNAINVSSWTIAG